MWNKNLIHVESQACYFSLSYMSSVQFAAKKMNAHSAPWKPCGKVDKALVPLFETKITTILLQSTNLFLTSKNEFSISPIHEFQVLQNVLIRLKMFFSDK